MIPASPVAARSHRAAIAAVVVLVVLAAAALTAWAQTRPSYDAYGWLAWGRATLHGGLDLNAAPSWKPLPYAFTLVYGLLGRPAALVLWTGTAIAAGLAGVLLAGRLAWRITVDCAPSARAPAAVAAILAGAALLAVHDEFPFGYLHYVLSAQSDPMIVAAMLGALELWLAGRPGPAFGLLAAAALGRPEAWPELIVAAAWLWRSRPGSRVGVVAALAAVALLWFGIPALASRSWWIAADNADASGFGPRGDRALGVLGRFIAQTPWPLQLAAIGMVLVGLARRERAVALLVSGTLVWMAVEVGFGLHGWPALGRYMFEPSAAVVVLGAGFVGRGLAAIDVAGVRVGRAAPVALAAAVAAVLVLAGTIPALVRQGRAARADLLAQHARTRSLDGLLHAVDVLGPARLRGCGEVISDGHPSGLATQTALAFDVGENVSAVGYRFPQPGHPHDPIVVFRAGRDGAWRVRALRQVAPDCRSIR